MKKYQVWLHGNILCDTKAETIKSALKQVLLTYGYKRKPKDTCVCEIADNYYAEINKLNKETGFDASNT